MSGPATELSIPISVGRDFFLKELEKREHSQRGFDSGPLLDLLLAFMDAMRAPAGFADPVTRHIIPEDKKRFTGWFHLNKAVPFANFCSEEEKERLLNACIDEAAIRHCSSLLRLLWRKPTEVELRRLAKNADLKDKNGFFQLVQDSHPSLMEEVTKTVQEVEFAQTDDIPF